MSEVTPYKSKLSKTEQVRQMFDAISGQYDFLNHFLSFGIDKMWRNKLVNMLKPYQPKTILDVATGTGDLALALNKLKPKRIQGLDLSQKMLDVGIAKIKKHGLSDTIAFEQGDSENLPYKTDTFDAATVAFGVRNFSNPVKGMAEICRVLKPAGRLQVLEFSRPKTFPIKQFYWLYTKGILPLWGRIISGDSVAYTYLPKSFYAFKEGDEFLQLMKEAGFTEVAQRRLSFGIATIYTGVK